MKNIRLKNIRAENFKGIRQVDIDLADTTTISGCNASGKTTLLDAFLWLLFGKDSQGRTDFQIRPVDEFGQMIDNVEIAVEATLEVDGVVTILRKVQSQVWTKKRGSTAPTFSGNKNEMEIDGFPASQRDYEAKIAEILPEDLFRLMTDPMAFTSMPWKEQREILLRFVSEITDKDVLELDEVRFEPVADDILAAGADKARDKAMAALKRLKGEQAAYPVRIDEAMRSKVPAMPEKDILDRKTKAEAELEIIRNEMDSLDASLKSYTAIQDKIVALRIKTSEIKSRTEEEYARQKMAARTEVTNALMEVQRLEQKRDRLCDSLSEYKQYIEQGENDIAELSRQYREIKSRVMPEDETICPTCGRPFEEGRIEEIRSDFEKRKDRDLGRIGTRGKGIRSNVNAYKEKMSAAEKEIASLTEQVAQADAKRKELIEAEKAVIMPDYIMSAEYQQLNKEIIALSEQLDTVDDGTERRGALKGWETLARQEIDDANNDLAVIESNKRADARIEELKAEQRDCAQKVADAEQALYLIEEFTKLKMDTLSERINSHFSKVRFKLFKTLINGAVQPTCVCQVDTNGSYVDFPNVNHAGQIAAGLDIIGALGSLYEVSAPVWIDNAEALDSNNVPEVQSQLILLKVSDDPELTVSNM